MPTTRKTTTCVVALVASLAFGTAEARIYKCVVDRETILQDHECRGKDSDTLEDVCTTKPNLCTTNSDNGIGGVQPGAVAPYIPERPNGSGYGRSRTRAADTPSVRLRREVFSHHLDRDVYVDGYIRKNGTYTG